MAGHGTGCEAVAGSGKREVEVAERVSANISPDGILMFLHDRKTHQKRYIV